MKGSLAAAALLGLVVLPAAYGQEQIDGANDLYDSVSAEKTACDDSCERYTTCRRVCRWLRVAFCFVSPWINVQVRLATIGVK